MRGARRVDPSDRSSRRNKKGNRENPREFVEFDHKPKITRARDADLKLLTEAQVDYDHSITNNIITFGVGPAGTGKTYVAAYRAAQALKNDWVERVVVTRPAIEAGETLGFLPGEMDEKYEPYFRPVRDALEEFLGSGPLEYYLKNKIIEARPLAYLRGATLKNAFVLFDEAQNTTPTQMKMFLSRIGDNAKVIVDGDPRQKDISGMSGLEDALNRLEGLAQVGVVEFDKSDIVRSGICRAIMNRYDD